MRKDTFEGFIVSVLDIAQDFAKENDAIIKFVQRGDTQGRGKWDRKNECAVPIKAIYIYPLNHNFRDILTRPD